MKLALRGAVLVILMVFAATAFAAFPEITQVTYNPSPAVPGSTITFLLQLENKDSTAQKGVTITLENQYPFTVKSTDQDPNPRNIGDISAYGSSLSEFIVYVDPTAQNQSYEIPITITTADNPSGKKTTFPIIISGKEPLVKVVSTSNDKLLPGEEKQISLELQNIGTSAAYDILVEMPEDRTITATGTVIGRDIVPVGAAGTYLASLNPGEKKDVSLTLSVSDSAAIKTYTQPVDISYRDAAGMRTTETSYVGLMVFGNADIDATLKQVSGPISAGQKADITIEVFNKGLGNSEFVLVELDSPDGIIENPKQFIGTLGPNDVDTVQTPITFTKQGSHSVAVNISYQDADATMKKVTIQVPISAGAAADPITGALPIAIIIIIIIAAIWYFLIRKKGNNKK